MKPSGWIFLAMVVAAIVGTVWSSVRIGQEVKKGNWRKK